MDDKISLQDAFFSFILRYSDFYGICIQGDVITDIFSKIDSLIDIEKCINNNNDYGYILLRSHYWNHEEFTDSFLLDKETIEEKEKCHEKNLRLMMGIQEFFVFLRKLETSLYLENGEIKIEKSTAFFRVEERVNGVLESRMSKYKTKTIRVNKNQFETNLNIFFINQKPYYLLVDLSEKQKICMDNFAYWCGKLFSLDSPEVFNLLVLFPEYSDYEDNSKVCAYIFNLSGISKTIINKYLLKSIRKILWEKLENSNLED